jgi:hypothetical protein
LFNASLEGNTRRAIDFHEGDRIDEKALIALIRAAVKLNMAKRPLTLALSQGERGLTGVIMQVTPTGNTGGN